MAMQEFLKKWTGKEALGIFNFAPRGHLMIDGKKWDFNQSQQVKFLVNKQNKHIREIEKKFVGFRGTEAEFLQSGEMDEDLIDIFDFYSKLMPSTFKQSYGDEQKAGMMKSILGKNLRNALFEPITRKRRLEVELKRAKTYKDKKEIREKYNEQSTLRDMNNFKRLQKFPRQVWLNKEMEDAELPLELMLTGP